MLDAFAVNTERIDFISSYCDRWCERCPYTARCSAFTAAAAIAMCGSVDEGLELAVGTPHPAEPDGAPDAPADWLADFENDEPTPAECAEFDRQEREREARIRSTPLMQVARTCAMVAHGWLSASHDGVLAGADDVVKEALAIVLHDAFFISVKLNRALDGRDRHEHDEEEEDHPVQNDWNGTAKVALISLERSAHAWRVVAQATGEETPGLLAEQLRELTRQVEEAFPNARLFVRPGFDEPNR